MDNNKAMVVRRTDENAVVAITQSDLMLQELGGGQPRIPRAGKVIAGLAPDEAKNYPRNAPYFIVRADNPVLQPAIDKALGAEPTALRVSFMHNFDATASIKYGWYVADHTCKCYSTDKIGVAMRYNDEGERVPCDCKREDCAEYQAQKCTRRGYLFLRLLDLEDIGIANPFMYVLSGGTASRIIRQVFTYVQMVVARGVPVWAPEFALVKSLSPRPYRVTDKKTDKVEVKTKMMEVVDLMLTNIGGVKVMEAEERKRITAEAQEAASKLADPVHEIDLGVDAEWEPVDEGEIAPGDGFSLTPDDERAPDLHEPGAGHHGSAKRQSVLDPPPVTPATQDTATKRQASWKAGTCYHCGLECSDEVQKFCSAPKQRAYFNSCLLCIGCQDQYRKQKEQQ